MGSSSSIMDFIDEVGESLGWISDLNTSGSFCFPAMDGIQVCVGGVALRGRGGVSDVVGIKLLPLPTNLPPESLSLCISCFCFCCYFYQNEKDKDFYLHFPSNDAKMFVDLIVLNCYINYQSELVNL